MTTRPPEFDDLIGPEVDGPERERLRRVHDLLVAAGPPPDAERLSPPQTDASVSSLDERRRRRGRRVLLGLAAALGAAAIFTVGLVVADDGGLNVDRTVAMSGPAGATASLEIYDRDEAGNWPMFIEVKGLRPTSELYELWLTREGKPVALCGSFLTQDDGTAVVPMNAPWRLDDFDGWVVVERGSATPVLST